MSKVNPCIYSITNKTNGKRYIGSAVQPASRFSRHRRLLTENRHHAPHLQAAWNKYGAEAFVFEIIELVAKDATLEREQYWMDYYRSAESSYGYNVLRRSDSWLGNKHTAQAKRKISAIHKGKQLTADHLAKLTASHTGPQPPEVAIKRRGARNPRAKLTEAQARDIKRRLANGDPVQPIATEYGLAYQSVWLIRSGRNWSHIVID